MNEIKDNVFLERLDKILVRNKISTFRRVRSLLQTHCLEVNGQQILDTGFMASPEHDTFTLDKKPLDLFCEKYIVMNKRAGTLCTKKSESIPTVYDDLNKNEFNEEEFQKLHSVGRLDMDTEGLLILTTNGDFSYRLTDPKFHVNKTYFVELKNECNEEKQMEYKNNFQKGIFIPQEKNESAFVSKPAFLEWKTKNSCLLTISEGKFHQVKRMFCAQKNTVTYLKRVSTGTLELDKNLFPGEYRNLTDAELLNLTGENFNATRA